MVWLPLGSIVSLPTGVTNWLLKWETLVGATVASIVASTAAYIALLNTRNLIRNAQDLENRRRERKHVAIRATLPLALAQVINYAQRTARALDALVQNCEGDALPQAIVPENFIQQLPSETLQTLSEFIEYADNIDANIVEELVSWIQIHNSRLHDIVERNLDPLRIVLRTELMARIIDAAKIYSAAASIFAYARRQQRFLPHSVPWEEVENTLTIHFQMWNEQYQQMIELRRLEGEPFGGAGA
jgi:hypothetical protein